MVDFIERDFEVENLDWVLLCISILGIVPAMGSAIAPFRVTIGKVSKAIIKAKRTHSMQKIMKYPSVKIKSRTMNQEFQGLPLR